MNWQTKRNRNKKMLISFLDFLKSENLSREQLLKLSTEIGRLQIQNVKIGRMTISEVLKDCQMFSLKINSKL